MARFCLRKYVNGTEIKGNKKCTFLIMQYTNFNQILCTEKSIRTRTMYDLGAVFSVSLNISHFQEHGIHTYLFSIDIPEIQLITSVCRFYYWTEDLMEWLT